MSLSCGTDCVVSHSECAASPDLHEAAAQDQQIRPSGQAPDQGEDGAHLQGPTHWRQAAGTEVQSPPPLLPLSNFPYPPHSPSRPPPPSPAHLFHLLHLSNASICHQVEVTVSR